MDQNPPGVFKPGQAINPSATTSATLTGDTKTILPGANVTFGPYSISLRNTGISPLNVGPVSHTYTITVLASTPGLVAGSSPLSFVTLGTATKTLTAALGKTATGSITVPVVMSSVFMDVKVVATFSPGPFGRPDSFQFPRVVTYPSGTCGQVTPGLLSTTDTCMQAAVNPTGLLVPDVMPLSIVYEPSGNCSWSNLTFSSTIGTGLSVGASDSTATNTLWNYSAAGGIFSDSSNTTQTVINAQSSTSTFTSTTSQAFGSSTGLPIQSPGNPNCNSGIPVGDTSATNGPGIGDQFVFVVQPTFLYWDTAGQTSFRLSSQQAPGTVETIGTAYTRQIDPSRPSLAPSFMSRLTPTQLQAIRGLDPFAPVMSGALPAPQSSMPVAAPSGAPLSPDRYIFLGRRCIGAGSGSETSQGTRFDSVAQTNLSNGFQSINSSSGNQATKNISLVVGGFVGLVTLATGGGAKAFDNFGKASSVFDQYVVHDSTTTTINENITTNRSATTSAITSFAETFFLKDQNRETDVDLYYDSFYGTIAFNELSCCNAPQTGAFANSCAFYDSSTQCTVGGTTMHCCPPGSAMIGLHQDANVFKCARLTDPTGVVTLDTGTQRNDMHACPFGQVMVGLHADLNQLACQTVPGAAINSERIDSGTQDTFPMHTCNWGRLDSAMSGVRLDRNQLTCASNPRVF